MSRAPGLPVLVLAGLLALAACDRPAAPGGGGGERAPAAATAFRYDATSDLSGYYMPVGEVTIGKWRLKDVFLGQQSEFDGWSAGSRTGTYAPVMVEFEDKTSALVQTEMGETPSGKARVLPSRYVIDDRTVRFEGQSPELGRVTFEGRLDAGALATARRNLGDEGVVLTGTLSAGGQTVRDVKLRWWMGD